MGSLDLRKAFDAMDRGRCLEILEGYGVGPNMRRLIKCFWDNALLVCRASGVYGKPFRDGRGVTQGGPLSPKLFNILVDAIVREWLTLLVGSDAVEGISAELMRTILAIFYADDAFLASRDPEELQRALDIVVELFDRVGLRTNTTKTQAMICIPGKIRTRLSSDSYFRSRSGLMSAAQWESRLVQCTRCGAELQASGLASHMASQHDVYVAYELESEFVEERVGTREPVTYRAFRSVDGKWSCPVPGCPFEGTSKQWNLRPHFRDRHPLDLVDFDGCGGDGKCKRCGLQCSDVAWTRGRGHHATKRKAAVDSAIALRRQFTAYGDENVLDRVEVFKYLGRLLAMDDNDAQAVRAQLRKARKTWMRVGKVLRGENASPKVCGMFYRAVAQSVLLFGTRGVPHSSSMAMNREHKPRKGDGGEWEYPSTEDALEECGLKTMQEYIDVRRSTVAAWIVDRPIYEACTGAERKRGSAPRQWWWEQELGLDLEDAIGSDEDGE
ncbi:hypothetical protein ACHAXT_004821 [Thalassiosira profunda]